MGHRLALGHVDPDTGLAGEMADVLYRQGLAIFINLFMYFNIYLFIYLFLLCLLRYHHYSCLTQRSGKFFFIFSALELFVEYCSYLVFKVLIDL